jgi:hypothetical protein
MTQSSFNYRTGESSLTSQIQPIQIVSDVGSSQGAEVDNSLHQAINKSLSELRSQIKFSSNQKKISDSIKILEAHEITTRGKRPDEITYEMKLQILEEIFKDDETTQGSRKSEKIIQGFDRIFSKHHENRISNIVDPTVKKYVVDNCDIFLFPLLAFFSPSGLKNILFLSSLQKGQRVLIDLNRIITKDPRFLELKNLFPGHIGSFITRVASQNTNPHILLQEILDNIDKLKIIASTFGFNSDQISSIFISSRTSFSQKVDDIIRHKDIIIKWIKESDLDTIVALLSNKNNLNDAIPVFDRLNIHKMIKNYLISSRDLKSFNSINNRIMFLKSQNSIEDYRVTDEDLARLTKFSKPDSKKIDSQDPHPASLLIRKGGKKRKVTDDIDVDIDYGADPRIGSSTRLSFPNFEEIPSQIGNSFQRVTHEEPSASISQLGDDFRNHVTEIYQHQPFSLAYQIQDYQIQDYQIQDYQIQDYQIQHESSAGSSMQSQANFEISDLGEPSQQTLSINPIRPVPFSISDLEPYLHLANSSATIGNVNPNQIREDAVMPLTNPPATSGNLSISASDGSSAIAGSAFTRLAPRSAFTRPAPRSGSTRP